LSCFESVINSLSYPCYLTKHMDSLSDFRHMLMSTENITIFFFM